MTPGLFDPRMSRWRNPDTDAEAKERQRNFKLSLVDQIANPDKVISLENLAQTMESDVVEIEGVLPPGLEDFPDLPVRLRGALGRALSHLPAPISHRFDPFGRPTAFEMLFMAIGQISNREEIPKPLVIHSEIRRQTIRIRARLFGVAGYWWPDVAEAMQLLCDEGISPHNNSRLRRSINVTRLTHSKSFGIGDSAQSNVEAIHVRMVSPLRLRSAKATLFSPEAFLIACANRVARMTRWQMAELDLNWGRIHEAAHNISCDVIDISPVIWSRGSQRASARIPVMGLIGEFRLLGNLSDFEIILRICEIINCGSHASLGFGRIVPSFL